MVRVYPLQDLLPELIIIIVNAWPSPPLDNQWQTSYEIGVSLAHEIIMTAANAQPTLCEVYSQLRDESVRVDAIFVEENALIDPHLPCSFYASRIGRCESPDISRINAGQSGLWVRQFQGARGCSPRWYA